MNQFMRGPVGQKLYQSSVWTKYNMVFGYYHAVRLFIAFDNNFGRCMYIVKKQHFIGSATKYFIVDTPYVSKVFGPCKHVRGQCWFTTKFVRTNILVHVRYYKFVIIILNSKKRNVAVPRGTQCIFASRVKWYVPAMWSCDMLGNSKPCKKIKFQTFSDFPNPKW